MAEQRLGRFGLACGLCWLVVAAAAADDVQHRNLRPGLDQLELTWKLGAHRGELTAILADSARYQLELLTEAGEGGRRRPQEWAEEFELVAVINASMYQANGRSTALLIDDGVVNNGLDHPNYGGVLAFQPRRDGLPPILIAGRDCSDYDLSQLRSDYGSLVQNYRLLDCAANAIPWRDERAYAASAVALHADGRIVFVHSGAPLPMRDFALLLKNPALRLRAALFTEGGAQAALVWRRGNRWSSATASSEGRAPARSLPNVLGLRVRQP